MHVHVVRPLDGWVLQRIAESLEIPGRTLGVVPDPAATVNLYVNYYLYTAPTGTLDVGWFTHRPGDEDRDIQRRFDAVAREIDACVAMCRRTAQYLDPARTVVLHGAADPIFYREPLVLGVVASGTYLRKRMSWIPRLRELPGIEVRVTGGELPFEALPAFYRDIDYLVVLSDNEGGPIPVLEALALKKPVIAPDVGFAWDYPVVRYDGTWEDLRRVVAGLRLPRDGWRQCSQQLLTFLEAQLARRAR